MPQLTFMLTKPKFQYIGYCKITPTNPHHEIPDMKVSKQILTIKGALILRFGAEACRKFGKMNSRG